MFEFRWRDFNLLLEIHTEIRVFDDCLPGSRGFKIRLGKIRDVKFKKDHEVIRVRKCQVESYIVKVMNTVLSCSDAERKLRKSTLPTSSCAKLTTPSSDTQHGFKEIT